jgi:subtilisin-like proprotein convertase family protein
LPPGLALEPDGRIAGAPTEAAIVRLRVRVRDADRYAAEGDVALSAFGPIAVVDRTVRDVRICFARRSLELDVDDDVAVGTVFLALRITATDTTRLVVKLVSPNGSEVYLRDGAVPGPPSSVLDVVYGATEASSEPLAWLGGEPARGRWTVELYDPRCPYPITVEELALVLRPAEGTEYLLVEGWTAAHEAGRPSVRVAGGGLEQSTIDLDLVRWSAGPDGVRQGGGGDDVREGSVDATWTTTLAAGAADLDPATGLLTAGDQTGAGRIRWQAEGDSGELPALVLPPDWVP